jgi:hypothetical protein
MTESVIRTSPAHRPCGTQRAPSHFSMEGGGDLRRDPTTSTGGYPSTLEDAAAAIDYLATLEVDGDHFSVADVTSSAWPVVIDALEELTTRTSSLSR